MACEDGNLSIACVPDYPVNYVWLCVSNDKVSLNTQVYLGILWQMVLSASLTVLYS